MHWSLSKKFFSSGYFLLALLLAACTDHAQLNQKAFHSSQGISFNDSSYSRALSQAKTENRPLFIMVHANWCSVCKKMKKEVLPQKELGDFYNAHFINAAVDFDSETGKEIRSKYGVTATPSFLFLDPEGNLVGKSSGYLSKDDLIQVAMNLKVGNRPLLN